MNYDDDNMPFTFDHCFDCSLGSLSLFCRDLDRWPFELPNPMDVQGIDANHNQFRHIPDEVFACQQLRRLYVMGNQLVKIPDAIGALKNLEFLDLSFNPIRQISQSIGKLAKLRSLVVCGGNLESVPFSIGHLTNLRNLTLGNELSTIPSNLGLCRRLTRLTLSANRLTKLPGALGGLRRLQDLRVDNNLLREIPDAFVNLRHLRFLHAEGNPLQKLPWFALEMPSLRGLSCCDFCVHPDEARRFTDACVDRGLLLLWNRSLCGAPFYQEQAGDDDRSDHA